MNKQQILAMASKDPRFQQGADILEAQLSSMKVTPEMLQELVGTLEYVMSNPDKYPQVRKLAIAKGFASEEDIPQQFQPQFIMALLLALYAMQDRLAKGSKAFARGGLAQYGRSGDSQLAHVNPMEAEVLRRMGGSGTVNPTTGLIEFKGGGLGQILSVVAPIALDFFNIPASGILGSMAVGGASAALGGGNVLQGALTGGLSAGLGGEVGKFAQGMLGDYGKDMSSGMVGMMGNALVGGAAGAATGQGALQGAARGVAGGMLGQATQGMGQGMQQAGQAAGNMIATGSSVQDALIGGGLTALAQGMSNKTQRPSDAVQQGIRTPASTDDYSAMGAAPMAPVEQSQSGLAALAPQKPQSTGMFGDISTKNLIRFAPAVLSLLSSAQTPQQVQQATTSMTPEQKAYFEKTVPMWDWGKIQQEAAQSGKNLGAYVAENWNKFTPGNQFETPKKLARGGLGMLMAGGGSGRDDTIDAKLSDGEYVFDAETTALVGDGSVAEGAKRLDQMREQIRRHKGKSLAKGKISPNAKSPLTYLKEVM